MVISITVLPDILFVHQCVLWPRVLCSSKLNGGCGPAAGSPLPPMGHLAMSED